MTVHPTRPGIDAGDASHDLADTEDLDAVFDLFDDLDGSLNRYGSLDPASGLAHRAVTPQLLAGLTGLDLPLCRAFHYTVFELLEDIGDFDGLIATSEFFACADVRRMPAADQWLFEQPAPAPDDDSRPAREVADQHSLALATAMHTNPSLTFGTTLSLGEVLLDGVLDIVEPDRIVYDREIEALTSVTLQLVGHLRDTVTIVGGARVWASAEPADPDLDGDEHDR